MSKKKDMVEIEYGKTRERDYNEDVDLLEAAKRNILRYSLETYGRAFPSYNDGLKLIHRRILYSMYCMRAWDYVKVSKIAGYVIGSFSPHGDIAAKDALVRMGQSWVLNYPYITGKGNFGTQDGDVAAAGRYIEAKLSDFTRKVIFDDLDEFSVDYIPNFDYTRTIPDYFPTRIPLVLINGCDGIGEGFRTSLPPHNLNEVADLCIMYINNKNIDNKVLVDGFYPDFPTGGEIVNGSELEAFYKNGQSTTVSVRGIVELDSNANTIILKEFPYGVLRDDVSLAVHNARKAGNMILSGIESIQDINEHDESEDSDDYVSEGANETKTTYEYHCKKDASMIEILNEIYKVTPFKSSVVLSFMVNQKGYPVYVTVKDIIADWYKVRVDSKRRRHTNAISQIFNKKHVLEGILSIYSRMDDVIQAIRKNKDDKDTLINKLHDKFGLTVVQAKGIYDMNLGSLSAFGEDDLKTRIANMNAEIDENEYLLNHIDETIIKELNELKATFGRPRRTKVIMSVEEHKSSAVALTKGSFIWSRSSIGLYDANGVKDSKNILTGLKSVKLVGRSVREIIGGVALKNTPIGFVICYDNGGINRIDISTFRVVNVWFEVSKEGMPLITCAAPIYSEEDTLICISNDNKIKRIKASDIQGKRILNTGSVIKTIVDYNDKNDKDNDNVLFVCENGTYNLCQLDDIPVLGRNASGVKSAFDEKERLAVYCELVPSEVFEGDRILVSSTDSTDGQNYIHSLPMDDFKLLSRTAKPKLLGLPKTNKITSIQLCDVSNKESQLCMIGKSSTSSLNMTNFRKPGDFKRLFITVTSTTQI